MLELRSRFIGYFILHPSSRAPYYYIFCKTGAKQKNYSAVSGNESRLTPIVNRERAKRFNDHPSNKCSSGRHY
jgi:hypothetical protein